MIKEHCDGLGRDYASIHRTSTKFCSMGASDEEARAKIPLAFLSHLGDSLNTELIGSPDTIRQRLAELEAAGIQELIIGFADAVHLDSLRAFAKEFIV